MQAGVISCTVGTSYTTMAFCRGTDRQLVDGGNPTLTTFPDSIQASTSHKRTARRLSRSILSCRHGSNLATNPISSRKRSHRTQSLVRHVTG